VRSEAPRTRAEYPRHMRIQTRWADNDVYGHVNNVVYYAYFDTVINRVLVDAGLDLAAGAAIGLCVESGCQYVAPASYPDELDAGLRVAKLGRSSVRYELAVFRADRDELCAHGHFVHVFVDRETRRPTPLPASIRAALEGLLREG
jgi:acyl-CoA thioester hydrolase